MCMCVCVCVCVCRHVLRSRDECLYMFVDICDPLVLYLQYLFTHVSIVYEHNVHTSVLSAV